MYHVSVLDETPHFTVIRNSEGPLFRLLQMICCDRQKKLAAGHGCNHEGRNSGGRQWTPATSRPVSADVNLMRNIVLNKLNLWSGRFEIRRDCKDNQY